MYASSELAERLNNAWRTIDETLEEKIKEISASTDAA